MKLLAQILINSDQAMQVTPIEIEAGFPGVPVPVPRCKAQDFAISRRGLDWMHTQGVEQRTGA